MESLDGGAQALTYLVRDLRSQSGERYVAKLLRPFTESKAKTPEEHQSRFQTEE